MASIRLPYGAGTVEIPVRDEDLAWVAVPGRADTGGMGADELVRRSLEYPIGTKRLRYLAGPGKNVAIVVDDVTRPTPVHKILPHVMRELEAAGTKPRDIKVVIALGTHRVMTHEEIRTKCGPLDHAIEMVNASYEDAKEFVSIGEGLLGESIDVLRKVAEADLIIGIGNIVPHFYAGWGGGAKIIQPGICDERTTEATHILGVLNDSILNLCTNPENLVRREMEHIAGKVGLDFIVNTVLDEHKQIVGVFSGHYVKAHRAGVALAEKVYRPLVPCLADIVVVTANPSHIDYWQGIKGLVHAQYGLRQGGVCVFAMSAGEGLAGGNEKHTSTIMQWAVKCADEIKEGIRQKKSEDLIAMAFCLSHRQMLDRARAVSVTSGIDGDVMAKLGFIPASDMESAMKKAQEIAGEHAKVGVVTYAGIAVRPE